MKKDFDRWNKRKKRIHGIENRPFFHEREIWFCYLGVNVGFEQDGSSEEHLRPVVIIRKFNNEIFWAIPLTKAKKVSTKASEYYFHFSFVKGVKSFGVLSQLRLVDTRRLSRKIGKMSKGEFKEIIEKLKELFP